MKNLKYIIVCLVALLLIGCEGMLDKNHVKPSSSADLDALAREITEELSLNQEQEIGLHNSIRKGDKLHPHPARLWQLAVELASSLSEEQLGVLLSPPEGAEFHDYSYGLKPDELEKSSRKDEFIIDILRSLLTDEQLVVFESILSYRDEQSDLLKNSLESEEINFEHFMLNLKALRMLYKIQIDDLLTVEQQESLESIIENGKPRHHHKGIDSEKMDKIREAKIEALEISDEQIEQLDLIYMDLENSIEEIKSLYLSEEITQENFRDELVLLFQSHHDNKRLVFTEEQLLIIDIHRVLAVRAHRHFFKSKWF